jgi:fluoroquinolone resistance protein
MTTNFADDLTPEYQDQTYQRLQQPKTQIQYKTFHNCTFSHCNFAETIWQECHFYECLFQNCDLSLVQFKNSAFVSTLFDQSKVIGVNWTDVAWGGMSPRKIDFEGCNISYSTFIHLKLPAIRIKNCIAHDADFAEADLTGADCTGTDFAEARFLHTNLTKANFVGARNYAIAPAINTIKKAKFSLPEAVSILRLMEIVLIE